MLFLFRVYAYTSCKDYHIIEAVSDRVTLERKCSRKYVVSD